MFVIALTYITCCFTVSEEEHRRTCSQAGRITLTRGLKQYAHAFSNVRHQPINLKVSVWDFPYVDRGTAQHMPDLHTKSLGSRHDQMHVLIH